MSFRRGLELAGFARRHLGRMAAGRRAVMEHLAAPDPASVGGPLPMPTFVQLRVTNLCNLRCKMCGQWGETGIFRTQSGADPTDGALERQRIQELIGAKRQLALSDYVRLLDEIAPWNPIMSLFGGEPFLYPDIVPLIASSIMSKKLAGGADAIVLDVKVGHGAFMRTLDDARVLAEQMADLGRRAEREVVCLLTDMDQPLGHAVGHALEVREAVATIQGEGPEDFTELVLEACARLLSLSDLGIDVEEGRRRAQQAQADGSALEAYERWIRAQGGDPDLEKLPVAPVVRELEAPRDAVVTRLRARDVGIAALELGGGRRTKDDVIDHAVGVLCHVKRGEEVARGDVLAEVFARDEESAAPGIAAVLDAYELGDEAPLERGILLDVVT